MTFGFEREYFVLDKGEPVIAAEHSLPFDGCGYLAEARGESHHDPQRAAYLMLAEEDRIVRLAAKHGLTLDTDTPWKLDRALLRQCARVYGKRPQTDYSMSGKWNKSSLQHAGLHVHFGKCVEYTNKDGVRVNAGPALINIPRIVFLLDRHFKDIIKESSRALGLYKIQPHGFEYRSLPAYANPLDVVAFIQEHREEFA
jgi:hypothetical protein